MTIKVTITHDQPNYDKSILVINQDAVPSNSLFVDTIRTGNTGRPSKASWWCDGSSIVIKPGESATFYVYGGRQLLIEEVPNVA